MPPSDPFHQAQALGRVEGTLVAVQESLRAIKESIDSERAEAQTQRQSLADNMSKVTARQQEMAATLASLRADMDEVKPITEQVSRWRYVGVGVVITVGAIGSVVGAGLSYFKTWILGGHL